MQICKIIGTVTATVKNEQFKGKKIMIAQPLDLSEKPVGKEVLAIDSVGAGVGDKVLVMQEGGSAQIIMNNKKMAVQAIIVGVVDAVDIEG